MPFNGSGVFSRLYNWVTDAGNNVPMTASRFDADANDMASALSQCLTRSGQSTPSANLPMGGYKLTGLAPGASSGDSVSYDQIIGSTASANFGFIQAGTGATARNVQAKLRESVSVLDFGADPTGATDCTAALNAFLTYVSANASRVQGIFPAGTYKYSTSLNFGIQNARIIAEGEVHLQYTGTSNAILFDAGASGSANNVKFLGNFIFEAPATAQNTIYWRGVHRSVVEGRVRGAGATYAGVRVDFAVAVDFRVRVSGPTEDSWYLGAVPQNGYYIDRRGVGENTSGCWFYPIVENVSGTGIVVDHAWQNQFIGGTSENGTGVGLSCTSNSQRNIFIGTDVENNTSAINDAGYGNIFLGVLAGTPGATISISGTGSVHSGGFYDAIADNGNGSSFSDVKYANNGGAFTGSGTNRVKRAVLNNSTGKFDPDQGIGTLTSSTVCANNTVTTVLSLPSTGNSFYQVTVYISGVGAATLYGAIAFIYQDGATARIMSQTNGGSLVLTLSGQNVQVNQTSGVSQTLTAIAKPI